MKNIFKLRKYYIICLLCIFSFSSIFFPLHSSFSEVISYGAINNFAIEQTGIIYAGESLGMEGRFGPSHSRIQITTNDGRSWFHSDTFEGTMIIDLTIERPGVVYFVLGGPYGGLYKTTNGGLNWFKTGIIETFVDYIAIDSIAIEQTDVIYAIGSIFRDYTWVEDVIFKTTNGGQNWFRTGFALPEYINSLVVEEPGVICAGTSEGLYKTTNGGSNWMQVGESVSIGSLFIEQPGVFYALSSPDGVYKTTNGGIKWFQTGLKLRQIGSLAIEKPGVIYAGAGYGASPLSGVYKSTNGGINWSQTGFNTIDALCLASVESEEVNCGTMCGIYKSTDGGLNWRPVGPQVPEKISCRYSGDDRYKTALSVSYDTNPNGAGTIILARGDDFADGLCGSPLATKYNGPLLLTHPQYLVDETREGIKRLKAKEIIMLGSNDALSDKVLRDIIETGISPEQIHRIGGATRYETSADIAKWLDPPENKSAFIVTGEDYPDAISVSSIAASYGMPILMIKGKKGEIPQAIKDVLKEKEIERTLIVGGSDVASDEIAFWLDKNNCPSRRIFGEARYETNINLVSYCLNPAEYNPILTMNPFNIYLAYGENFPDALAAGVIAAKTKSPLILTRDSFVPQSTRNFFSSNKNAINLITIVGGEDVISDAVKDDVLNLIKI